MQSILHVLRRIDTRFFLLPFLLFAFGAIGYVAVQGIFFQKDKIFPQGVRYIPDQIIVKYKIGQSPDELQNAGKIENRKVLLSALSNVGVASQKRLYISENSLLENYYVLTLKPGFTVPDAYNKITKIPEIENAAPDYILKIQEVPNDPYYPSMWNLSKIKAELAWDSVHVGGKVTIAVIDTGVDYQHEDLKDIVIKGKNFISNDNNPMDDQGHGTHVAGIAAAVTNNGIGISGATWGAKILAIKACDKNGDCSTANVSRAIQYAVDNNAKIINVSIAGSGSCNGTYTDVLRYAARKGAIVVVAAGNGNNGDGIGVNVESQIPASCEGSIAVGSITADGKRSGFSNFGSKVEISAPGGVGPCTMQSCIISTSINNSYSLRSGTSMAAPQVSAVAALILAFDKNLSMSKIKSCILSGGDNIQTDKNIGLLLNAQNSLKICTKIEATPTPKMSKNNSSIAGTVFIDENKNKKLDSIEKTLSSAQIILSGLSNDSVLSNSKGKYLFLGLPGGLYTISATLNGQSVIVPIDVSVASDNSVQLNIPVSSEMVIIAPTPSVAKQKTASYCFIDPECLKSKNSVQICSFRCE